MWRSLCDATDIKTDAIFYFFAPFSSMSIEEFDPLEHGYLLPTLRGLKEQDERIADPPIRWNHLRRRRIPQTLSIPRKWISCATLYRRLMATLIISRLLESISHTSGAPNHFRDDYGRSPVETWFKIIRGFQSCGQDDFIPSCYSILTLRLWPICSLLFVVPRCTRRQVYVGYTLTHLWNISRVTANTFQLHEWLTGVSELFSLRTPLTQSTHQFLVI